MIRRILTTLAIASLAAHGLAAETGPRDIDCQLLAVPFRRIERYWTPERMAAARPFSPPLPPAEELQRLLGQGEEEAALAPFKNSTPTPAVPGVPVPADVSKWPFRTAGRLFWTSNGTDYWCTAELAGSGRTVLTAAHCVRGWPDGWFSNFYFVRAYENGDGEGTELQRVATWKKWVGVGGPNFAYDYAFFQTVTPSEAGWIGISTPLPFSSWMSIGYPRNFEKGQRMYRVHGVRQGVNGKLVAMQGNSMGGGASGGAWIGSLGPACPHCHYVLGLNSITDKAFVYSPLFDAETMILLAYVANGCPAAG